MGLQRTPPQNVTRTRRDDTFSPSQAFAPGSRLARSPAGAAPASNDDEMEVEAGLGAVEEAEEAMDVDDAPPPPPPELVASSSRAPRTPAPSKAKATRTPAPAPVTPAAPRSTRPPRKSQLPEPSPESAAPPAPVTPHTSAPTPHRTPAQVLAEPAVPVQGADDAGYGKYYETLVLALKNNTVDRGLSKWT